MSATSLPVVDPARCTACGDCVDACPKGLFVLQPVDQRLLVQCKNLITGEAPLASCQVACTACGKCVLDGAPGLISVASGLAVINYDRIAEAEEGAVARCPTGAIVWLDGPRQFARSAARSISEHA
jgi:ferredoxin